MRVGNSDVTVLISDPLVEGEIFSSGLLFPTARTYGKPNTGETLPGRGNIVRLSDLPGPEDIIEPYNKDASLSVIPGKYFCEELR